jgi:fatty aldehyde-generating acyl-ACP reductase
LKSKSTLEDTFAFVIHPIQIKKDVGRKFPLLGKILNEKQINFFSRYFPPIYISHVEGIRSEDSGRELEGWLISCPFTPPTMMSLPVNKVYNKIVGCGHMAEELGAKILGLGAFTSVVGDSGITIANRLDIPVTTGDSYTVIIGVHAIREAAITMGIPIEEAKVAVVGATGTIGKTSAQLLARECAQLTLIGRRKDALESIREECEGYRASVTVDTNLDALYEADLILTVTSAISAIIEPKHIKPGAVILDVARPRDVSHKVAAQRDDILIIDGGVVDVPGPVDFHFDFGYPAGKAYSCMAETMALALEGRYEDYTLGDDIRVEQALEIEEIAGRHGFKLAGFRSFEKNVTDEQIARVSEKAAQNRKNW